MSEVSSGITRRSIAITIILIPLNFYWTIIGEVALVGYSLNTYAVPFYNVIFTVFVLVLLNTVLKKISGVSLLDNTELLTVYILLSAACALSSISFMTIVVTTVGHAFWYATPENEWQHLLWNHLPNWLVVKDKSVLTGYYEGGSSLYTLSHIKAWLQPMIYWCLFTICLIFVMLCINVIFRERWIEHEHLSYPVTQIAYRLTCNTNRLLSSKIMWTGFTIAASIAIINGLSFLIPGIPTIPVKRAGGTTGISLFTKRPWNAIGAMRLSFYPFVIGLGLLMPLDLAFSSWFFYLFRRMELVLGSALGINVPGFPYSIEQTFGAALGICLSLLVFGRRYLIDVLRTAFGSNSVEGGHEPVKYKFALLGVILGSVFLLAFSIRIGMSLWFVPIFFGVYFVIVLAITRVRAEQGFPVHHLGITRSILLDSIGTRALGANNLTSIALPSV